MEKQTKTLTEVEAKRLILAMKRENAARLAFNHCIFLASLVRKDFQIKENYIDINGNHPKAGKGMKAEDIVFEKSELVEGKLLIGEDLKEHAKGHIAFLKKRDVRFFVY